MQDQDGGVAKTLGLAEQFFMEDLIQSLVSSRREEMEITDVNKVYIERGQLTYDV